MTLVEPLVLPALPAPRPRGAVPLLASIVPVVAGVAMWLVTGSLLALCFAALGPLMAVASLADGARTGRRDRRRAARDFEVALGELEGEVLIRHAGERELLCARHPDVARLTLHADAVWRPVAGSADSLVIGRGDVPSVVRVVGADARADTTGFRSRASVLLDAPLIMPLTAGVCVQGPPVLARAVLRALVVQLCLAQSPAHIALIAVPAGEGDWAAHVPHRQKAASRGVLRLAATGPGEHIPADADIVLTWVRPASTPPTRCGALLSLTSPEEGELSWAAERTRVGVEALSAAQARAIAASLSRRHGEAGTQPQAKAVTFAEMRGLPATGRTAGGLSVAIGREGDDPAIIDLVADGPHAIVAGVTGSGKSELLITWIATLCAAYSTAEVSFLLADFKGGTAFDSLAELPHVTGVITDLDGAGAKRAVESLRAEVRFREGQLASVGARDIADPRVQIARLVIVVDEFAAVLAEHPDLNAVFIDVAARGRALGMHLVLGTQRVSGVVRDALLANCPLRISLRVADAQDSRAVVGTDEAAHLPGDASSRGLAWVRRAADAAPVLWRIALTSADDIHGICRLRGDESAPRRSWLPALPSRVALEHCEPRAGGLVLGLADEPDQQRQCPVILQASSDRGVFVIGGGSSGKSSLLGLIASQHSGAVMVSDDPERAWDTLSRGWTSTDMLLFDDVDALLARLPGEYAQVALERLEQLAREAGVRGAFLGLSAQRCSGALARVADLVPHRVILGLPSRADHIAAGGEMATFAAWVPPGRGTYRGRNLQCAVVGPAEMAGMTEPDGPVEPVEPVGQVGQATRVPRLRARSSGDPAPLWSPTGSIAGIVTRGATSAVARMSKAWNTRVLALSAIAPGSRPHDLTELGPLVIVGDADSWQAHWGLLQAIRAEHTLIVDAACPGELRTLAGERALPPFALPSAGRAWLCADGHSPRRISLPRDTREGGAPGEGGAFTFH